MASAGDRARALSEGLNALAALACPAAASSIPEGERLPHLRRACEALADAIGGAGPVEVKARFAELTQIALVDAWSTPTQARAQIAIGTLLHALGLVLAAPPAGCPIHGPSCGE